MTAPMDSVEARDAGGRIVREAWVRWAQQQPNPKPTWLVPYDELSEPDKEADRQIYEAVAALAPQAAEGAAPEDGDSYEYRHQSLPGADGNSTWLPWQRFTDKMQIRRRQAAEQRQEGLSETRRVALLANRDALEKIAKLAKRIRSHYTTRDALIFGGLREVTDSANEIIRLASAASSLTHPTPQPAAPASGDGGLQARLRIIATDYPKDSILRATLDAALAALAAPTGVDDSARLDWILSRVPASLLREFGAADCGFGTATRSEIDAARLNTPPAGAAPEQGEAVAEIVHAPDAVTQMRLLPAGIHLGYGTHKVYTAPPLAGQREDMTTAELAEAIRYAGEMIYNSVKNSDRYRAAQKQYEALLDVQLRRASRPPSEASGVRVDEAMEDRALNAKVSAIGGLTVQDYLLDGGKKYWSPSSFIWEPTKQRLVIRAALTAALTQQPQGGDAMGDSDAD